jgi:hypothetical protein
MLFRPSIRRMHSETWLDKATRLQRVFAPARTLTDELTAARERIELALWLRHEFSDEPPGASRVVPFEAEPESGRVPL